MPNFSTESFIAMVCVRFKHAKPEDAKGGWLGKDPARLDDSLVLRFCQPRKVLPICADKELLLLLFAPRGGPRLIPAGKVAEGSNTRSNVVAR